MRTAPLPAAIALPRSKRLVSLAGDERLVEQIRHGDELAFEVAFERHSPALLSFCRHMLGSREEAEDAVQHAFTSAYRHLRNDEREINLKPWLFAIARNRCLSMLRARRDQPSGPPEIPTPALADQAERRGELRDLLEDLRDLPEEQRAALLLSEVSGLSHAEIGGVLDCEPQKVKALVFRARSGLIERREAREAPCKEIREQLANLRGGSLRRGRLRHHLRLCEGCRQYRLEVRRQRQLLAAVLPVIPSPGLKEGVLGALGLGGGSAGGGALLGGLGAAGATGSGSATVAKLAILGALAGGGAVAGDTIVSHSRAGGDRGAPVATQRPLKVLAPGGLPDKALRTGEGWIGGGTRRLGGTGGERADGPKRPGESPGARHHGGRGKAKHHQKAHDETGRARSHGGTDRGAARGGPEPARGGQGKAHAPNGNGNALARGRAGDGSQAEPGLDRRADSPGRVRSNGARGKPARPVVSKRLD